MDVYYLIVKIREDVVHDKFYVSTQNLVGLLLADQIKVRMDNNLLY